ncbi:sigma factor-like helix-turn-helix DNA-binding protein [Streptomyces filamentosus]|uniref:sigma factor-like helix-turn-helix DNA-binding protein n=1 Tax=Streptomyces filamentosus TaxID=67294 RepID=UPI0033271333
MDRTPVNRSRPAPSTDPPPPTAESAFDDLYLSTAPSLTQQAYVLTGCRRLAFEAVEYAFQQVWEHWPEVARDPDPAGWARARTHEYALSPWHRLRLKPNRSAPMPSGLVTQVLLELPPWQRRTVLLCDGLDLSVEEAAEETQATNAATADRLRNARAALGRRGKGTVDDTARPMLRKHVEDVPVATLAQPWSVRAASERRARTLTRAVFGATAALVALVTVTSVTGAEPGTPAADSHTEQRAARSTPE